MEEIVLDYSPIFQTNGPIDTSAIIDVVQPVVTNAMNEQLTQDFRADEVHRALSKCTQKSLMAATVCPPSLISTFGLYRVSV